MAQPLDFRGRYVLVTGASSGLGLELARELAKTHEAHLVLVARRRDRLEALAQELEKKYGTRSVSIAADLTRPDDVERIFREATAGREVYAAILNAGVTYFGEALQMRDDELEALVHTNVLSTIKLTNRFVPYLLEQRSGGGVMLVSSVAGFVPMPFQAAYGGSKAFVTSYGRALAEELRGRGVSVTVFAPGGIATEMMEKSGLARKFKAGDVGMMEADQCARLALGAFRGRREVYVPGALNQLTALVTRLAPPSIVVRQTANIYRGALPRGLA